MLVRNLAYNTQNLICSHIRLSFGGEILARQFALHTGTISYTLNLRRCGGQGSATQQHDKAIDESIVVSGLVD